jgi:hypothetical protein
MPSFRTKCPGCGATTRTLKPKRPELVACSCGVMPVFVSSVNTQVKETIDNGVMPRKVEQLKGVEEMMKERSTEPKKEDIV